MSNYNKDVRGVLRGPCKHCGCLSYVSHNGTTCTECHHAPTKHKNMDTASGSAAQSNALHSRAGSRAETKHVVHSGSVLTPSYSLPHYDMYGGISCSSSSSTSSNYQYTQKQCNACHSVPVHFDDKFGFFDYCSPKCRDEDFLPKYNKKLAEDIDNYHTLSTSITLPYQSSSKTASSRLTTSPKDRSISTRTVNVELTPKESLGLVLVNDGPRIIVVGATTPSSIKLLRDCNVYLLDCIQSVNEQTFSRSTEVTEYCNPRTMLRLSLDHTSAIKDYIEPFFQMAKKKDIDKVLCLRNFEYGYGFKVDDFYYVSSVVKGSEAEKCGLKKDENIVLYTTAGDGQLKEVIETVTTTCMTQFKTDIQTALENKHYLVIGVCMYVHGSYV